MPWEGNWRPRVFGGSPEPMMRARGQIMRRDGGLLLTGPPYQRRAASLLYQIGDVRQGATNAAQTVAR
eukprot:9113871-Lingulodinium_polyedra.AAC.1